MGVQLNIPQQQHTPLTPGANSPQQSAAMKIDNMNKTQAEVNKIGGKIKKNGGGNIEIPPTSTASYNANGTVASSMTNNLTAQANSEYDKGAFVKGGSKKRRTIHKTKKRSKHRKRRHRTRRYRR